MPLVSTIPAAKDSRNLAGRVRRLLSSIVCSYSPRSIQLSFSPPLRPTLDHIDPQRNPLAPRKGQLQAIDLGLGTRETRLPVVIGSSTSRGTRNGCGCEERARAVVRLAMDAVVASFRTRACHRPRRRSSDLQGPRL